MNTVTMTAARAGVRGPGGEARGAHSKYYLPDEPGCEAFWYHHALDYAAQNLQLLLCPRATPRVSADKWVAGGYGLSSNLAGAAEQAKHSYPRYVAA